MTEQVAIPGAVIAGQASPTAAAAHRVCASAQAFRLFIAIAMIRQKDYIISRDKPSPRPRVVLRVTPDFKAYQVASRSQPEPVATADANATDGGSKRAKASSKSAPKTPRPARGEGSRHSSEGPHRERGERESNRERGSTSRSSSGSTRHDRSRTSERKKHSSRKQKSNDGP